MGMFTQVAEGTFDELALDAGVLLRTFDPASPSITPSNIICATTGGIQVSCTPTFSDFGEDIDNCPPNTKELKHIDGYECTIGFTALNITPDVLKLALGCANVVTGDTATIKPDDSAQFVESDGAGSRFDDIYWVGDLSNGGFAGVKLINALSTGGLSLQTSKNGKGQLSVTLTGHVTLNNPSVPPIEFFVHSA